MTKRVALSAVIMLAAMGIVPMNAARANGLDPIMVRQAGFSLQAGDFAFIRSVLKAKGDVRPLAGPAKAIAKWAKVIPTLFPKGSEKGEDTDALPAIWSNPAGFQKIALTLASAATKLAADAKADNAEGVAADAKLMGQQCGACHKTFRER